MRRDGDVIDDQHFAKGRSSDPASQCCFGCQYLLLYFLKISACEASSDRDLAYGESHVMRRDGEVMDDQHFARGRGSDPASQCCFGCQYLLEDLCL